MIKIQQPISFCLQGGRKNNEDSIYPSDSMATSTTNLFIVCDGVGGKNKGEVASHIITSTFSQYVFNFPNANKSDIESYYQKGIQYVEQKMSEYVKGNPECEGMASTLTFLHILEDSIVLGWIGDSRIYHVRDGEVVFKSKDHSLVNRLVDIGEISEKEALTHPQKNVIVRALKGQDEPVEVELHVIDSIKSGDYFLLCTDGLLETLKDEDFDRFFKQGETLETIKEHLLLQAKDKTNDNYSSYILKVDQADFAKALSSSPSTLSWRGVLLLIPALALLGALAYFFWQKPNLPSFDQSEEPKMEIENVQPAEKDMGKAVSEERIIENDTLNNANAVPQDSLDEESPAIRIEINSEGIEIQGSLDNFKKQFDKAITSDTTILEKRKNNNGYED